MRKDCMLVSLRWALYIERFFRQFTKILDSDQTVRMRSFIFNLRCTYLINAMLDTGSIIIMVVRTSLQVDNHKTMGGSRISGKGGGGGGAHMQ